MAVADSASYAAGAAPAGGILTGRLSAMMFMQFFVWGAWNVTLGLVMQTVGIGNLIGNAFSVGPIASIVGSFLLGMAAARYVSPRMLMVILHLVGGVILFARDADLGIVGTCALQKTGERQFELTKMGVLEEARGRKVGEFLLTAMLDRAAAMGVQRLYLLTSSRCAAAIHLYEKNGFRHDAGIMRDFGSRYARCDVALLYRG